MADINFGIRLTATDGGMIGTVRLAEQEIDKLSKSGNAASNELRRMNAETSALAQAQAALGSAVKAAAAAFGAYQLVGLIKDSALLAARYETLGVVMRIAGNNAGYTGAQMNAFAKELQASGISMLQSREALTNLATANIDLANATKLGRAAQDLAVVGNVNSSEALGRLIHGIKAGQVEILRTLGLNVSFEDSYKKLAAQLGTTSDKLSENQKMQARTNAVLVESARYNGIYEESMTTAGKAMTSLTRYWEDFKVSAGEVFLPTLGDAVNDLTTALKAANAELAKAGSAETIDGIGDGLAGAFRIVLETVVILGANVAFVFKGIGREIGAIAAQAAAVAQLDFSGAKLIGDEVTRDAEAARKALDAFEASILNRTKAVAAATKMTEAERIAAGKASREATENEAKRGAASAASADVAKKALGEYTSALEAASKMAAVAELEFAALWETEPITAANKALTELMASDKWKTFNENQRIAIQFAYDHVDSVQAQTAAIKESGKELAEWIKQQDRAAQVAHDEMQARVSVVLTYREQNENMRQEIELIGSSTLQRELLAAEIEYKLQLNKLEGTDATLAIENLKREYEERKKLLTLRSVKTDTGEMLKKEAEEWKRTYDKISDSITDALLRGFESGKSFAENFRDTLVNMFKTLVLRPTIQALTAPVAAGIAGLASGGAQASGIGDSLGGLGSSGIGSLLFGGVGDAAYAGFQLGGGASAIGTALTSGLSAGLAAIPVAGWVALGALVVYGIASALDKGPAQRTGTFASGAAAGPGTGNPLFQSSSAFGDFGVINDKWFSDSDMGETMKAFMTGVRDVDNAISAFVGKDLTAQISANLATFSTEFEAGIEHQTVEFGAIMLQRYTVVLNTIDPLLGKLLNGFSGTGEELAKFVVGLVQVRQGLLALDIKGLNVETLQAFATAGEDLVDTFNRVGGAYLQFVEAFTTPAERLKAAQTTVTDTFNTLGIAVPVSTTAFRELVQGLDLATEADRALFTTLMQVAPAFLLVSQSVQEVTETIEEAVVIIGRHQQQLTRWSRDAAPTPSRRAGIIASIAEAAANEATAAAEALRTLNEAIAELGAELDRNPVAEALAANASQWEKLTAQGNALDALTAYYDGSETATRALAQATRDYTNSLTQMLAVIGQLKLSIAAMFADSIRYYQLDGLDKPGQYEFLRSEVALFKAELEAATDPARINYLAQQINADQRQAYGLLDPAEREQVRDLFIAGTQAANDLAQQRLQEAEAKAQERGDKLIAEVRAVIDEAMAKFTLGAELVRQGGSDIITAARTIDGAEVSIQIDPSSAVGSYGVHGRRGG